MVLVPVPRDVDTATHPDLVFAQHVIQKSGQCGGAARPPGQTTVQSYGHHLRLRIPFSIEGIEGIAQVSEKLIATVESLVGGETHIVVVQSIGNDQMRPAEVRYPIGKIIRVRVCVVQESTVIVTK